MDRFDPDPIIESFKMPYHLAAAFRAIIAAAAAELPVEKMSFMGAAQEHVDSELARLRLLLQKQLAQPERLFGATLDTDYGLAEEALAEARQRRDFLKTQSEGGDK
jgi:hypothetical protein